MILKYVTQPHERVDYLTLFRTALDAAEFSCLDAAVAYATMGGVKALQSVLGNRGAERLLGMRKRWLVGIDWRRSDPVALDALANLSKSTVKIPNGADTVQRLGCTPKLPFHPKAFVLSGQDALAIISGSGNLSRNGMTRGHECGTVLVLKEPMTDRERQMWNDVQNMVTWFDDSWRNASAYSSIRTAYQQQYESIENLQNPPPTDDDSADTDRTGIAGPRRRAVPPRRLRQLRAARCLWIETGNLHANRGEGKPGNQLMMSPMTRVYFGFLAQDVDPDTLIGHVTLRFGEQRRDDCSLRFSNNSMDVLTMPVPGWGGPERYDRETLRFEKQPDGTFVLTVGTTKETRQWRTRSQQVDGSFTMTSGRQWGVF